MVFYNDIRSPVTPDLIGKLCVVGLADDRVVVKKIKRQDGEYVLISNTEPPMANIAIVWAARVIDMRPQ
ncbi:phage repressor protein [Bradyrhizobium sp. Pear76]|nr:phage repressor protein [Bradyrhizobium oropedii]